MKPSELPYNLPWWIGPFVVPLVAYDWDKKKWIVPLAVPVLWVKDRLFK